MLKLYGDDWRVKLLLSLGFCVLVLDGLVLFDGEQFEDYEFILDLVLRCYEIFFKLL